MTDLQIGSLARKYIDEALAKQETMPSDEAYEVAVAKVEVETRKLLETRLAQR
jgi:hypothetical protein